MPTARPPLPHSGADPGRRRLLGALLGAPLAVPGLAGCGGGEEETPVDDGLIELSVFWYGSTKRAELTEKALRLYSARNPRVSFRVTWQGLDGYYDRLATQAAGGNVPDLIQVDDTVLTEYARRGILLDLGGYAADHRLDLRGLPPGLVRYAEVDGRTMGVAAAQTSAAVVYNRALLRRLGVPEPRTGMSWQEYVDWAARVTRAADGRVAGTMDPSGDHRALWLWLRSRGGELYQGRQLGFGASDLVDWFELWQAARTRKATPSAALVDQADNGETNRQLVVTGHTAASFAWAHQFPELQRYTNDELAMAAFPGPPGAQWARASMYWAAFRGTRRPDVVAEVINFLTTNMGAGLALGQERGVNPNLAIRRYVEESVTDAGQQRAAALAAALADGLGPAPSPPPKGHARVRALLVATAEGILSGRSGIRPATSRFIAQANAALAE
ncbi:putative ABC transporter substrate-binding protein YesO [Micromonospora sp. MW-13]|uniref:ABC transporter substrate-binding protein n=1 Tax=Micromonospora sp. MW-13 TaxID=2094022 RepID=UPI000E4434F8|nr:extracellular solute-binding protein [Micromonospora sp. MW-13]RGC70456.1 putative ABC transporter substrate-binding protein YesO [Micromonospora sp. MW-13]